MNNNLYINEVRIPLEKIQDLKALKYQAQGLSAGHKKKIEFQLTQFLQRTSLFEGDVLFCIVNQGNDEREERELLSKFLNEQIRNFSPKSLEGINLNAIPGRTLERLIFAIVSNQAYKKGLFTIYGRTLFKPTQQEGKLAHVATETTLFLDDKYAKLDLTPTFIALVNINQTYREERHDLELVTLCKHRVGCPLSEKDGSCPYQNPGKLGYYSKEISIERLPSDRQQSFKSAFEKCPSISEIKKVVLVKASKKADSTLAFPPFIVHARFSKTDLATEIQLARKYRNATLMNSAKRFNETSLIIHEIFNLNDDVTSGTARWGIQVNDVELPVDIVFFESQDISSISKAGYKAIQIPLQNVVNDMQNPQPKSFGGGWMFSTWGAYDRNDANRIFDKVNPYLIVPKEFAFKARSLLNILTDGEYKAKTSAKNDTDFLGINRAESRKKYNTEFINVWDVEEGVYTVEDPNVDYWKYVLDIKRDWNKDVTKDLSRIALVVVPSVDEDDENSIYHRLKKVFVEEGIPSQFITTDTLDGLDNGNIAFGPILQSLWLNIYSKMGGKPWRLANRLGNVHAFIGIGFGLNPREKRNYVYAGVAHVFDRYGSWVDIASDYEDVSDDERKDFSSPDKFTQGTSSYKISRNLTQSIIYEALRLYQQNQSQTGESPKNIILHKLGKIYDCEVIGFLEGIRQILGTLDNCKLGILQIEQEHQLRLYGDSDSKPMVDRAIMRGRGLILDTSKLVLATTGSVLRGSKKFYFGIGTPNPLLLTSVVPSNDLLEQYKCGVNQFYKIEELTNHVMALTQLHWGSSRDNIRLPITTLYARKVADLISKTGAKVHTWTKYNRPWFL